MKHLKPSHREKKRYLLLEGANSNKKLIEQAILDYIGILGYAKACPKIIEATNDKVILSINRETLNNVRAAFLASGLGFQVKKVSGTLKKLT